MLAPTHTKSLSVKHYMTNMRNRQDRHKKFKRFQGVVYCKDSYWVGKNNYIRYGPRQGYLPKCPR